MNSKPVITYRLSEDFYEKLDKFAEKVLAEGNELFADDFSNVENFCRKAALDTGERDDHSFRRTPKPFYLLEALYFKIFDEANREAFNDTRHTVVILPQCLALRGEKCKRKETRFGKTCAHCSQDCQVHEIVETAREFGVESYFSKRDLVVQLGKIKKAKKSVGAIGISCILTLSGGMRSSKEAGLPSRGVLLNFTGCRHWADQPFTTETDIKRLRAILEEKYGLPDSSS